MAQQQQLPSFRQVATRHRTSSYTYAYTPGQALNISLNRQGYLSELRVKVEGTLTVGTGGTVADPFNGINFLTYVGLKSPQGDYPISLSGRNLFAYNYRYRDNTTDVTPNGQPLTGLQRPGVATWIPATTGAQTIDINYIIPIAMNLSSNFDTGLLLTQIANNDFTLQLNCAQASDLIGAGTAVISSFALTVYIEAIWFEVIAAGSAIEPDTHSLCRLRDSVQQNLAVGDNYIGYQLGPVLMDAMHTVYTNILADTSLGANFNYLKLVANRQIELENRRGKDIVRDNFLEFGKQMPPGVLFMNFFDDALPVPNATMARDFINTNQAAQLDFVLNIATGTTLNTSAVASVYRELVTLGS